MIGHWFTLKINLLPIYAPPQKPVSTGIAWHLGSNETISVNLFVKITHHLHKLCHASLELSDWCSSSWCFYSRSRASGEKRNKSIQNKIQHRLHVENGKQQRFCCAEKQKSKDKDGWVRDMMQILSWKDSYKPPETVCPLLWLCTLWWQPSFLLKGHLYLATCQEKHIDIAWICFGLGLWELVQTHSG